MLVGDNGGIWWCGVDKVVMVVGVAFECAQGREGWVQKNLTTKYSGLILGVPWQMAVEGYIHVSKWVK